MSDYRFFCLRGFMKSGTNWLGKLLDSHPQVSCRGEYHWQEIVGRMQNLLENEYLYQMQGEDFRESIRSRLESFIQTTMIEGAKPGSFVLGDRTPHTCHPLTLRQASHISIIRDGRDVLVSRIFHLYNFPGVSQVFRRFPEMAGYLKAFQADPWFFHSHPEKLLSEEVLVKESMTWWRDHLVSDRQTAQTNPGLPILFVKYEDLHRSTNAERERLFDFLQVDPALAAPLEGDLMPGFERERPNEFFRKGVVGDWQNYMTPQAREWINEVAGEALIQQGYAQSLEW
jgi:hypothetical protein